VPTIPGGHPSGRRYATPKIAPGDFFATVVDDMRYASRLQTGSELQNARQGEEEHGKKGKIADFPVFSAFLIAMPRTPKPKRNKRRSNCFWQNSRAAARLSL
jgi:hypothetical protein